MASVRLRAHVYRLTLREDITADVVQESVMEMISILGRLNRPDRFWPWLYGIALNKLRRHRRDESRHRTAPLEPAACGGAAPDKQQALERLLAEELRQAIAAAMKGIKDRHRAVLSMRCYDGMSFAEIASALGCSEFGAQMLFYRAKKSLARQLGKNGLSKATLLTALIIFGKMTAPDEAAAAAIAVTATTLKVAPAAAAAALAAGKTALLTTTTAAAVSAGAIVVNHNAGRAEVAGEAATKYDLPIKTETEQQTAGEYWYYFPQGTSGPVMMRQVRYTEQGESLCRLLQNEHANYTCDAATVEIRNARTFAQNLCVWRLPTDGPELTAFLNRMEGHNWPRADESPHAWINTPQKGLLVIAERTGPGETKGNWRVDRHENMLHEEYFQFAWPASSRIVDRRDAMHARGWTHFEITGHMGAALVHGQGRVPFVYSAYRKASPWLQIQVGAMRLVDAGGGAAIITETQTRRYDSGTFMIGLGRPWMGLHTIDTVRRDAANACMEFETRRLPGSKAQVEIRPHGAQLVYTIDLERDVIEELAITAGQVQGLLQFNWLHDVDTNQEQFVEPHAPAGTKQSMKGFWLIELAETQPALKE